MSTIGIQRWQTSLYGGYTKVWYDGTITNDINSHLPGSYGTFSAVSRSWRGVAAAK